MDASEHPEWAGDDQHPGFFQGFGHDDNVDPPKRRKKRRGRWVAPLISLIVLVVIVVGAAGAVLHVYQGKHKNFVGDGTGRIVFKVEKGDTSLTLAPRLLKDNVIAATDPFVGAAKNSVNNLQPGYFVLHRHMNAAKAWAALNNPRNQLQTSITIPDGERATAIIAALPTETGISLAKFKAAIADTSALGLPPSAHGNPEGYLYPATYNFPPGTTALQMLQAMVKKFNSLAASINLVHAAQQADFTEAQVITEASLLEAEVDPGDYPKAARVIDNRLNIHMTLGLDSTVLYALNISGRFNLTMTQLNVKSPYNTRLHTGLPPGPIDSPDLAAIEAALHPSPKSDKWIYFVTIDPKTGRTGFTASAKQFEIWSQESDKNIRNGT